MHQADALEIARGTDDTMEGATRVMADAFENDAGMNYIANPGDAQTRRRRIEDLCRYFIRYTERLGIVSLALGASEVKGVACWLPPASVPVGLASELAAGGWKLPMQLGLASLLRAIALGNALARQHRENMGAQRHWYLFQMAVAPKFQRQGVGGKP